jgi:hypothetical protein
MDLMKEKGRMTSPPNTRTTPLTNLKQLLAVLKSG